MGINDFLKFSDFWSIQVIFTMTEQLLRFAVVMAIVLLGFAMSFHALLWELPSYTFTEALLDMFTAMLGDTDLFDKIHAWDHSYHGTATLLMVAYLVIMTIVLLNLLIAVLSTVHATAHGNIAMEYNVSKTRLIGHYVWAVNQHVLPAPFNLLQLVIWCASKVLGECFRCNLHEEATEVTSQVATWLFFCPVVVVVGSLAWLLLLPRHLWYIWHQNSRYPVKDRLRKIIGHFTGDGPVCLLWSWLKATKAIAIRRGSGAGLTEGKVQKHNEGEGPDDDALTPHSDANVVERLLQESADKLGVAELQKYLDDPFVDLKVRYGEWKRPTTVRHMKLLGKRLESAMCSKIIEELQRHMEATSKDMRNLMDKITSLENRVSHDVPGDTMAETKED